MTGSMPAARQEAVMVGKRLARSGQVPGVEEDVVGAGRQQHPVDALGDDVARGEFGEFVLARP